MGKKKKFPIHILLVQMDMKEVFFLFFCWKYMKEVQIVSSSRFIAMFSLQLSEVKFVESNYSCQILILTFWLLIKNKK